MNEQFDNNDCLLFQKIQMAHTSSSMVINPNQKDSIAQVFEAYVTEHHSGDILNVVTDACEDTHHPIVVNAMTLFETNMEVSYNAFCFQSLLHCL